MNAVVIMLVLSIALGTLLFFVGYGALFLGAFSKGKAINLILLITLGFSSVIFVAFGFPWYYSLPFWLIPALYAQLIIPPNRHKTYAMLGFWLGLGLFFMGTGILTYTVFNNTDVQSSITKFKQSKKK